MMSGTRPAFTPVASFETIWLSGMTVSWILSGWPEFHRLTRCVAALAPLARTHMLRFSPSASDGSKASAPAMNTARKKLRRTDLGLPMCPPPACLRDLHRQEKLFSPLDQYVNE